MASPFSIGDLLGVANLLFQTYTKCKAVSGEYTGLQDSLQSTRLLVNSVYYAVQDTYGELPRVLKDPFVHIMSKLRSYVLEISKELNEYSNIRPGQGPQLTKLKFSILQNPQETRSKLDSHKQDLSLWMSTVTCYSMTKTTVQYYSPSEMFSLLTGQTPHPAPTVVPLPTPQPVKKWYAAAAKSKNSFMARGVYTYSSPSQKGAKHDVVIYRLSLHDSSISGTSHDSAGNAEINGHIDPQNRSVRFLKRYTKVNSGTLLPVWDYVGCFIECGIVGEWQHTKDHPKRGSDWRGRFSIWLKEEEEDESEEQIEDQLKSLEDGKVLTRSNTRTL